MDLAVYENVANTRYTRPTYLGPYAQHGTGDTPAAQSDANVIHKEEMRVCKLGDNVDAALKK